jgi:RNA polymerase sigma factor (sigma-70 family)
MDDRELLRQYVDQQSHDAFAELVRCHLNLVFATAMRIVGEPHTAEDVAQTVFIHLARKASLLREGNALPGWLYRVTCGLAKDSLRTERRRRERENEAVKRAALNTDDQALGNTLAPLLDEAMQVSQQDGAERDCSPISRKQEPAGDRRSTRRERRRGPKTDRSRPRQTPTPFRPPSDHRFLRAGRGCACYCFGPDRPGWPRRRYRAWRNRGNYRRCGTHHVETADGLESKDRSHNRGGRCRRGSRTLPFSGKSNDSECDFQGTW